MINLKRLALGVATLAAFGAMACGGGGESGEQAAANAAPAAAPSGGTGGAMSMPDWMTVDQAAKTVTLKIVAGQTDANNHWNFNGHHSGDATITVPAGSKVTIQFSNNDPAMAHSIGVSTVTSNFPAMFDNPQPAFAGAISANPTDAAKATQPGKSETVSFTADKAGDYTLLCFIPAHALSGMWVHFKVSADGSAGVSTM